MRVFITGIAGFFGIHIADGHEVSGCHNLIGGYIDNAPEDTGYYQCDCCDLEFMKKLTRGIDIVYHTACTAYEELSALSLDTV